MRKTWYARYDRLIANICPEYRKGLDALARALGSEDVVELGCGTGNLTAMLARSGRRVIAYDNDAQLLAIAKRKLKCSRTVTFTHDDALHAAFSPGIAVVSSLLFHLMEVKRRYALFSKIAAAGVDLYVFDRVRGETDDEEKGLRRNFQSSLRVPPKIRNMLVRENRMNHPDRLSEQADFFARRGYTCTVLYRNPQQGFMAYCFLKSRHRKK